MQKPKYNHPASVTGIVLMHAHLLRQTDKLSPKAKDDLACRLRNWNG